jgi:opine dehydrogenase
MPSHRLPQLLHILKQIFPSFCAGSDVLATSLENIGAVFHPVLTILNASWIESTEGNFQYYLEGISPSVAKVLEAVDQERLAIAEALGARTVSAREWLYLSYQSPGMDLLTAIRNTTAYRGIMAPSTTRHRYIEEDVPMSLVPLESFGQMQGVATPTISMLINLANVMHGTDYRAKGRTISSMGIAGLSLQELRSRIAGGENGKNS